MVGFPYVRAVGGKQTVQSPTRHQTKSGFNSKGQIYRHGPCREGRKWAIMYDTSGRLVGGMRGYVQAFAA